MRLNKFASYFILAAFITACAPPKVGVSKMPGVGAELVLRFEDGQSVVADSSSGPRMDTSPRHATDQEDEDVGKAAATLRKGEQAPFTGTLLSPAAVAEITSELSTINQQIEIEKNKAVGLEQAKCNRDLGIHQAELDEEKQKRKVQVELRDKQIEDLNNRLGQVQDPPVWLWVGGGAVSATILTLLGVFVVEKAQ